MLDEDTLQWTAITIRSHWEEKSRTKKNAFCFTLLQVILHSNAYNADTKLNG